MREYFSGGIMMAVTDGCFRLSTDSMVLADFCRLPRGAAVCDLGCGCGALGLLLFNMSMPVTLYAARDILREGRATAFGLLTLGLFLGMLPAFSGASGSGQDYAMICLISIMLIRVGVGKR